MPSGPGGNDARGIYQYGEADVQALASDLLNLLAASTSTQFGADRTRLSNLEVKFCLLDINTNLAAVGGVSPVGAYTELRDANGWHDPTTNPSRITPNVAGLYRVEGFIDFAASSTGVRVWTLRKNGAAIGENRMNNPDAGNHAAATLVRYVTMNGTTDYLDLSYLHNAGGALAAVGSFMVEQVRP